MPPTLPICGLMATLCAASRYRLYMAQTGRCQYGRVREGLEAATSAYRAAQAAVGDAERALTAAKQDVPVARERLHAAIAVAARSGMKQVELISITGYNRESIRRILRAAGIEPE